MRIKPIDSTTKILRNIQTEPAAFRREVNERLDLIEQYLANAIATATRSG